MGSLDKAGKDQRVVKIGDLPIYGVQGGRRGSATGQVTWHHLFSTTVPCSMHGQESHPQDDDDLPIVIEPDSGPTLLDYDRSAERATFTIEPFTYVVEVPYESETTQLSVTIRHADRVHTETLNLAAEAACRRFAGNSGLRLGVSAQVIAAHLPLLLSAVQELRSAEDQNEDIDHTQEPTGIDRDDTLKRLRSPTLLDDLCVDLASFGWVGEGLAKQLALLTAISRKLPNPLWSVSMVDGLQSSPAINVLAAVTPPEDLVHVSRLSPAALAYQDANALRHKLVLLDHTTTLTKEVSLSLQILKSRGAISQSIVPRHNLSGSSKALNTEIKGPIALIAGTTPKGLHQIGNGCCHIPTDTSPEHLQKVQAAERTQYTKLQRNVEQERSATVKLLHNLQRMLHRYPVVIPFANSIQFPSELARQPGVQTRFLGLVAASALLHQYQRLKHEGHIIADHRDFEIAQSLAGLLTAPEPIQLGVPATTLWSELRQAGLTSFTQATIRELIPHWGRRSFRTAVTELLQEGFITDEHEGRGIQHTYHVITETKQESMPAITLQVDPKDEVKRDLVG